MTGLANTKGLDFSQVLNGLIGFSMITMIAGIALLVVIFVGWFLSQWIIKRALNRTGVEVKGLIFVPIAGQYHMISKLGCISNFKLFGIAIPKVVPKAFVILNVIGIVVLPMALKLFLIFAGWVLNGAVYTRVWDIADGKEDGASSVLGILSAMIPIVFLVKCFLMAFSEPKATLDQFMVKVPQEAEQPAKQKEPKPKKEKAEKQIKQKKTKAKEKQKGQEEQMVTSEPPAQQAVHLQKVVQQAKQQKQAPLPVPPQQKAAPVQSRPIAQHSLQKQQSAASAQPKPRQISSQRPLQPLKQQSHPVKLHQVQPRPVQQNQGQDFNLSNIPEEKKFPDSIFL